MLESTKEKRNADGWEPFCTNYGFYPISKTIGVFAQWSVVLPVKMRIVTNGNDVLCKS